MGTEYLGRVGIPGMKEEDLVMENMIRIGKMVDIISFHLRVGRFFFFSVKGSIINSFKLWWPDIFYHNYSTLP